MGSTTIERASNNANSRAARSFVFPDQVIRVSRSAPLPPYRAIVNFAHLLHTVVKMNGGLGCVRSSVSAAPSSDLITALLASHTALLECWPGVKKCDGEANRLLDWSKMKSGQFSGSIGWWVGQLVSEGELPWARLALPRNPSGTSHLLIQNNFLGISYGVQQSQLIKSHLYFRILKVNSRTKL